MSEFRYNPLSKTWVLISEVRAKRPQNHLEAKSCPFCPGNEQLTPPEIMRLPWPGENWQTRVVPNKFNVLAIELQLNRLQIGTYLKENGVGAHEVIIDHPHPDHRHPAEMHTAEWLMLLKTIKMRMEDLVKDKRLKYPVLFKNHGPSAGATIEHPHWQLIVLPIVPQRIEIALDASCEFFQKNSVCLLCQIIGDEIKNDKRLVWQNDKFIVWLPYAARFPYELTLAPKFHYHRFEWLNHSQLENLAEVFPKILKNLR